MKYEIKDHMERLEESLSELDDLRFNIINILEDLKDTEKKIDQVKRLKLAREKIELGLVQYQSEFDFYLEEILGDVWT